MWGMEKLVNLSEGVEVRGHLYVRVGDFWLLQTPSIQFQPKLPIGWWVGNVWRELVDAGGHADGADTSPRAGRL